MRETCNSSSSHLDLKDYLSLGVGPKNILVFGSVLSLGALPAEIASTSVGRGAIYSLGRPRCHCHLCPLMVVMGHFGCPQSILLHLPSSPMASSSQTLHFPTRDNCCSHLSLSLSHDIWVGTDPNTALGVRLGWLRPMEASILSIPREMSGTIYWAS